MSNLTPCNPAPITKTQEEEEDHLICSTKKIKSKEVTEVEGMVMSEIPTPSSSVSLAEHIGQTPQLEGQKHKSFKDALAAPKHNDFYFDENMDSLSADEEDAEGDTYIQDGNPGVPQINLPKRLLEQIRKPWANALIVRLLGKSIGYKMLCIRVKNLWGLQEEFNAIDLG